MSMGGAYRAFWGTVCVLRMALAGLNNLCLTEPEPLFIFTGYGDNALEFQFSVWAASENFLTVRNDLYFQIKAAFDEAGIEIPFPQSVLSASADGEPLRVKVMGEDQPSSTVSR